MKKKTDAMRGSVKRYSYEKAGTVLVVVIDKKKGVTHKTGYITLCAKLFKDVVYIPKI